MLLGGGIFGLIAIIVVIIIIKKLLSGGSTKNLEKEMKKMA